MSRRHPGRERFKDLPKIAFECVPGNVSLFVSLPLETYRLGKEAVIVQADGITVKESYEPSSL